MQPQMQINIFFLNLQNFFKKMNIIYLIFFFAIVLNNFSFSQNLKTISNKNLQKNLEIFSKKNIDDWIKRYEFLHQNPELSFQEKNTSNLIAIQMKKLGFEVTENVGGFGVVSILKNGKGKTIMVRTDTDALPLLEKTNLSYASKTIAKDDKGNDTPVMHACGHDIHISVFLALAEFFAQNKNDWKGTLLMVAQPAEERGRGATQMLENGLFTKFPLPDMAFALHCNAQMQAGKVGFCSEYAFAGVDTIDILVNGMGGHGAAPHTTIDPVVISSQIVMGLQTIISREINPIDPAVITVGSLHCGTKHSIITDQAKLQLTVRAYKPETRNKIIEAIQRKAKYIALSANVPQEKLPEVIITNEKIPAVYNNPELTQKAINVAQEVLGKENVLKSDPVMIGEDFGLYGLTNEKIPICIFWLGTISPEKMQQNTPLPSLHSGNYAPEPRQSILTGVKVMGNVIGAMMNDK